MIEEKVKMLLVEVLGLEDEEGLVTPEAGLVEDLAAESIDFIDICFRLEKDFGLKKVTPGEIFPPFLQEENYFGDNQKIFSQKREEVAARLSKEFPHMRGEMIDKIKEEGDASAILQVKNLLNFVKYRQRSI